jgi:hypothetical protein
MKKFIWLSLCLVICLTAGIGCNASIVPISHAAPEATEAEEISPTRVTISPKYLLLTQPQKRPAPVHEIRACDLITQEEADRIFGEPVIRDNPFPYMCNLIGQGKCLTLALTEVESNDAYSADDWIDKYFEEKSLPVPTILSHPQIGTEATRFDDGNYHDLVVLQGDYVLWFWYADPGMESKVEALAHAVVERVP